MSWSRPLCLTALLASLPSSALAAAPDQACAADGAPRGAAACPIDAAPGFATRTVKSAADDRDGLVLDCSPLALGGLVSGPGTGGLHASQLVNATIRHCSKRGFVYGVARLTPRPSGRVGAYRLG